MPTGAPTVLATSGGIDGGRPPKMYLLATAMGDDSAVHRLIGDGTLPAAYATADGAGLRYRGTEFVEPLSEKDGAAAYFIDRMDGAAIPCPLPA